MPEQAKMQKVTTKDLLRGASIYVDAQELLDVVYTTWEEIPKCQRYGVGNDMKAAVHGIISAFAVAYQCPEVRLEYIHRVMAHYAVLQSCYTICRDKGIVKPGRLLQMAEWMEKIQGGVAKWHNAASTKRQLQ